MINTRLMTKNFALTMAGVSMAAAAPAAAATAAAAPAAAAPAAAASAAPPAAASTSASSTTLASAGAAPVSAPKSTARWGDCPADITLPGVPSAAQPTLQCATIKVPLNYRKPHSKKIDIAISRLPSKSPAKRRGILLTNPGGPGQNGLSYPAALTVAGLPQSVRDTYDIIGMDPRGIGHSTQVACNFTPTQQKHNAFSAYAHNSRDVVRAAGFAYSVAQQCAHSSSSSLLPYITTANTARDLDQIRVALGEKTGPYLGASYGSYLGAVYATLFRKTSDRVVIDSNLGPRGYNFTGMRRLAQGMEDRFPDFAAFAVAHPEYHLGSTPRQVRAKFDQLVAKLDKAPVKGFDGDQLRFFTFTYLYGDATFPNVAALWRAVDTGAATLPLPADEGEDADADNTASARLAVICSDSQWPTSLRTYELASAIDRTTKPLLGGATGNIGPCAFWPRRAHAEPPVKITGTGPANVLMIQNTRDPGTPLVGARAMRKALGSRAVLVAADAGGHGVYPFVHNTCADNITTRYLVNGKRPAHDRACPANPASPSASTSPTGSTDVGGKS